MVVYGLINNHCFVRLYWLSPRAVGERPICVIWRGPLRSASQLTSCAASSAAG